MRDLDDLTRLAKAVYTNDTRELMLKQGVISAVSSCILLGIVYVGLRRARHEVADVMERMGDPSGWGLDFLSTDGPKARHG